MGGPELRRRDNKGHGGLEGVEEGLARACSVSCARPHSAVLMHRHGIGVGVLRRARVMVVSTVGLFVMSESALSISRRFLLPQSTKAVGPGPGLYRFLTRGLPRSPLLRSRLGGLTSI
jgi:hypothetical protein